MTEPTDPAARLSAAGRGRMPSMADVAALAGVSHQAVSRVLNSPEVVREQTAERVHAAITQLGFRRNLASPALVTRRSRLIGLATGNLSHFGPAAADCPRRSQ